MWWSFVKGVEAGESWSGAGVSRACLEVIFSVFGSSICGSSVSVFAPLSVGSHVVWLLHSDLGLFVFSLW